MATPPTLPSSSRRHDVDWVRVIALFLLIIYHLAIAFQPWAHKIYYIQSEQPLTAIWLPLAALNIWRIPILFLISGMGLRFSLQRRTPARLLGERSFRILLPFLFAILVLGPLNALLYLNYYQQPLTYIPNAGHAWFLGNIFLYVLLTFPLVLLYKKFPHNPLAKLARSLFQHPASLLILLPLPFALEGLLVQPDYYSNFAETPHGFWTGLLSFLLGFLIADLGDTFARSTRQLRFLTLTLASILFAIRLLVFEIDHALPAITGIESILWMLTALGFASQHLNQDSPLLQRLSPAVFPIYLLHFPVQYLVYTLILPLPWPPLLQFLTTIPLTFLLSWLLYELLRRISFLRPLFGMKYRTPPPTPPATTPS
ncbi:MAG: acyltransferase [Verrucomicrobiota bacterium]